MSELLNKILDRENMNQAYQKVKANKGSAGIDGREEGRAKDLAGI